MIPFVAFSFGATERNTTHHVYDSIMKSIFINLILLSLLYQMGESQAATAPVITVSPAVRYSLDVTSVPVDFDDPMEGIQSQTPKDNAVKPDQLGGDRWGYVKYEQYELWDVGCSCVVTRFRPAK